MTSKTTSHSVNSASLLDRRAFFFAFLFFFFFFCSLHEFMLSLPFCPTGKKTTSHSGHRHLQGWKKKRYRTVGHAFVCREPQEAIVLVFLTFLLKGVVPN